MAAGKSGGDAPKKKDFGYAYKFPKVEENPASRTADGYGFLRKQYQEQVIPSLKKEFNYQNPMEVPSIQKVVLNIGMGEAVKQPKFLEQAFEALGNITGQRPVVTRARKSIAGFKLREGMRIGCMVTLRRYRMWDFMERLLYVALPRTRDFRGISRKAFDGRGNYTLGVKELLIFPEVDIEKMAYVPGVNISIQTTAKNDAEGRALLKGIGMPFREA